MSSRSYDTGVKALQDLLPPLEDCPNCGSKAAKPKPKSEAIRRGGYIALATLSGLALHFISRPGKKRRRF